MKLQEIIIEYAPYIAMAVMGGSLICLLWRYFRAPEPTAREGSGGMWSRRAVLSVLIWFLVSRLIVAAGAVLGAAMEGRLSGMMHNLYGYWVRWDAPHYVGLAENWYVNAGDPRYHIVFYPLYPLLARALSFLTGAPAAVSAVLVSNICFFVAGLALREAVRLRGGEAAADRALRLMMLFPLSVFCSVPYTEGLFLMVCALAVLLARRERFGWAVFFGALAAATRMPGVLIAIPIYYEMLGANRRAGRGARGAVGRAGQAALVSGGLMAYLGLNWAVTGNPLKFVEYQSGHWGQNPGFIWDTLRYTLRNAFSYHAESWRLYTWIPQAVFMVLALFLLAYVCRRIYPADGAFMWAYMFVALGTTWLLSGPRYLFGLYAVYPALAGAVRRPAAHGVLCAAFGALLAYASYVYAVLGNLL